MKLRNKRENILPFILCIILIFTLQGCGLLGMNTADSGISVNSWRSRCLAEYLLFSNMTSIKNSNEPDQELDNLLLTQLLLCLSECSENSELQETIFGKTHCGE
ncbi:hypothetical protein MAL08_04955 [Leptospira noguchii]|nr:hypothetical protein [Leptospira noguchii]UOG38663.1 hypothetical protein MAL08_04955 [Leptospira noguchii]